MDGFISKIQSYSTKDGPGIRSSVFAVGCNLKCKWCSNPELIEDGLKIFYHREKCVKCGSCAALSGGTIQLDISGCVIDRKSCTNLNECADACFYDAYESIGQTISASELAAKLLRDKAFFDQSGGGVTYSGGEPALQSDFFLKTTSLLKKESIHVALDTAGNIPWKILAPLVESVDMVLYDIKTYDNNLHYRFTGSGNNLILENARLIAEMKKQMMIRMILVPGINDNEEEIVRRLTFVRDLGKAVIRLDLLKYHRLAAGKYLRLGLKEPMSNTPECSDDIAVFALHKAHSMGLEAYIGV